MKFIHTWNKTEREISVHVVMLSCPPLGGRIKTKKNNMLMVCETNYMFSDVTAGFHCQTALAHTLWI